MKTKKPVFTVSCVAILIILAFSIYKSYFHNPLPDSSNEITEAVFNAESMTFSEFISEMATDIFKDNSDDNDTTESESESETETEKATQKSTEPTPPSDTDFSCFDNTVFIGNSRFVPFKNYGLCKNVYAVVGLTVDTIFTKSASGNGVPVIDELYGKDFEKVILMLGDNECGWPNQDIFIERYAKVIDAIRQRIPDADIIIQAVLPISAEASAKNEFGCNNNAINSLNTKIKQLCADEEILFLEQPSCLKGADGTLLSGAASDGIHLNKNYAEIWLDYLDKILF